MQRYTLQQRIEIIKIHYRYGESFVNTVRKTKALFGRKQTPSRPAIVKLVKKFERLGQVNDVEIKSRKRRSRTAENIAAVARSVCENPNLSIPLRSLELGIPQTTLYRILHTDLLPDKEKPSETVEIKTNANANEETMTTDDVTPSPAKVKKNKDKKKKPVSQFMKLKLFKIDL